MRPIIVNSEKSQYGFNGFIQDVKQKTSQSIENERILVHCILVYSRANPIIAKIINNYEYYNALDEVSGKYINIYHANANLNIEEKKHIEIMSGNAEVTEYIDIYKDSKLNNMIIEKIKKIYNLDIESNKPLIWFFCLKKNTMVDNIFVEIDEVGIEDTYNQIIGVITEVVKAVRNVDIKNIDNQEEIFDLAKTNIKFYKIVRKIYKITSNPLLNVAYALEGKFKK